MPLASFLTRSIPGAERNQLVLLSLLLLMAAISTAMFALTRSFATLGLEGKLDAAVQAAVCDRLLSLPVPFFPANTARVISPCAVWGSFKFGGPSQAPLFFHLSEIEVQYDSSSVAHLAAPQHAGAGDDRFHPG